MMKVMCCTVVLIALSLITGCGGSDGFAPPTPNAVRSADGGWTIEVHRLTYWGDQAVAEEAYQEDGTHVPATEHVSFAAIAPVSPQSEINTCGGMTQETYEVSRDGIVFPPVNKDGWLLETGTYTVQAAFQHHSGGPIFRPTETLVVEPIEGRWGWNFGWQGEQPGNTVRAGNLYTYIGREFNTVSWTGRNDSQPGEAPGRFGPAQIMPTEGAELVERTATDWRAVAPGVVTFVGTNTWTHEGRTIEFEVTRTVTIEDGRG